MPVSDEAFRSLMWHPACRSPMSLRSDMLVSDGSTQTCQSWMGNVNYRWGMYVSYGSLIRHVGLQWSMSVYDEAC